LVSRVVISAGRTVGTFGRQKMGEVVEQEQEQKKRVKKKKKKKPKKRTRNDQPLATPTRSKKTQTIKGLCMMVRTEVD